jgi:dTDP-glucose pyrophosphorylase
MEKFLGILFCGGRGTRLGEITRYISKAFVPVYDRPIFMYPLAQLQASTYIDEIVILTNRDNDAKLKETGHRTILQDDRQVHDMFSGLRYLRKNLGEEKPAILMPCDNISDISVDDLAGHYLRQQPDIALFIKKIPCKEKQRQMGVFDPEAKTVEYKPAEPKTPWGVLAPYIVKPGLDLTGPEHEVFNRCGLAYLEYSGIWFDIGDIKSLKQANDYLFP